MTFTKFFHSVAVLALVTLCLPARAHDIGDNGAHIHGDAMSAVNEPLLYGILLVLGMAIGGLAVTALKSRAAKLARR